MRYFLSFSFLLFVLLFPAMSFATGGLVVEPVFQEVIFGVESTRVEFVVTLKNTTTEAVTLRSSVVDFGSLDESGGVAFLGEAKGLERKYGLASWMQPKKNTVFLEGGETETFPVVIENRESLSPGGHYGALLFQVGRGEDTVLTPNMVAVNQLISVLVFAKKKGGEIYDLRLQEKEWSKNPLVLAQGLRLRLQNAGNTHVTPRGVVTLTDPVGRVVKKGILNPESTLILPETLRTYTVTLQSLAWALVPGRYTLTTTYRYDGTAEGVTTTEQRFFFPWPGGVVFILGVLAWSGHFLRKRHVQRIKK